MRALWAPPIGLVPSLASGDSLVRATHSKCNPPRYARTESAVPYCVPLAVVCQEVTKLVMSVALLAREEKGGLASAIERLRVEVLGQVNTTLKLAIPAMLFFTQNICAQMANTYLPAALFQVTYQGKTFVVALLSVLMLGSRLSRAKWFGIVGLAMGVCFVQLSRSQDNVSKQAADEEGAGSGLLLLGLGYVIAAALCSGFANVYFEKMIKVPANAPVARDAKDGAGGAAAPSQPTKKPNIWIRNVQLALFTIMIGIPTAFMSPSYDTLDPFHGFSTSVVFGVVVNNACGGLMVALVVKYADNIVKGFSNAISTVLATMVSIPLFGFEPTAMFFLGVALVTVSSMVYGGLVRLGGDWWDEIVMSREALVAEGKLKTKDMAESSVKTTV